MPPRRLPAARTKPATLRDVANATGVHPSTVSRVVNPETRRMVGDDVARRVLATASAMNTR